MKQQEFDKVVQATFRTCYNLLVIKGGEYAGSEDRLANFKRGAGLTGSTSLQIALIYAAKHWDSISSYVKAEARNDPQHRLSEPIEGRLDDLINYCILMKALVLESLPARVDDTDTDDCPF